MQRNGEQWELCVGAPKTSLPPAEYEQLISTPYILVPLCQKVIIAPLYNIAVKNAYI